MSGGVDAGDSTRTDCFGCAEQWRAVQNEVLSPEINTVFPTAMIIPDRFGVGIQSKESVSPLASRPGAE